MDTNPYNTPEEMMALDITWKNPPPHQEAALALALQRGVKHLTEFNVAEFICLAKESLWYSQAKTWREYPPIPGNGTAIETWRKACAIIVEIVDLGYNQESGIWWDLRPRWQEDKGKHIAETLILMDFGHMLRQFRRRSLHVISQGFEVFIQIVCGRHWERQYAKFLKRAQEMEIAEIKG